MSKGGIEASTVIRNTAPGRICRVKIYTLEYRGAKISGTIVSERPNREYTFPEIKTKHYLKGLQFFTSIYGY